jgi:hypothetical protein
MKVKDGIEYLKIGEVADRLERSTQTIKIWYEWYENQSKGYRQENPFPEVRQDVDKRRTRYYKKDEIKYLVEFKKGLEYGDITEVTRDKWGERGKRIKRGEE